MGQGEFKNAGKQDQAGRLGQPHLSTARAYEFPTFSGTQGPDVVDIRKFYDQTGMFTYDPGFTSTASTESNITFIDGDKGVLQYRGYPIADLAEHSNFVETCYLLLYGELPNKPQMDQFWYAISHHTMVHEQLAASSAASAATPIPWP